MSVEKRVFGDMEDCLNSLEELLDGRQSAMGEFCKNLLEFEDTIGEVLSYREENLNGKGGKHVSRFYG